MDTATGLCISAFGSIIGTVVLMLLTPKVKAFLQRRKERQSHKATFRTNLAMRLNANPFAAMAITAGAIHKRLRQFACFFAMTFFALTAAPFASVAVIYYRSLLISVPCALVALFAAIVMLRFEAKAIDLKIELDDWDAVLAIAEKLPPLSQTQATQAPPAVSQQTTPDGVGPA